MSLTIRFGIYCVSSSLIFTALIMLIISQVDFGILFDIDGVIGRGAKPLAAAQRMIKLLTDKDGKQIVPLAFCTNSTGAAADKAKTLTNWLDIEVRDSLLYL